MKVKLPSLEQIQYERSRRSSEYFISNFVYIEDKTSPTGICRFNLWPKQGEVLEAFGREQFCIVLKARQLGLTWLTLAYILWKLIFNYGFLAIAISKRDDPDAKELAKRMKLMLRYLPEWLILEKKQAPKNWRGMTWEASTHEVIIDKPDGESSRFLTLPASPDTAHSFTANLVMLDEWALHPFADEIWTGAYPTMNRPDYSGQVIGISTGRAGTLFEQKWNEAQRGENMFRTIFLNWKADPRRTDEWYEQTKKNLPNTHRSQYPVNPQDAFTVGEGAFFPEWDEEVHVIEGWRPPKEWKRVRAYDPGFSSRACMKWYAISPDGWAVCYREYYPTRTTDEEQAKEINRLSVYDDGEPEKIEYTVADTDAWVPSRDRGESTADIFRKHGIRMRQADKNLENGWRRLHEWLRPFKGHDGRQMALLRFTRDCYNTIRTYPGCEQSKTNPEDIAKDCEHHCQDVDRYFVMSRPKPYAEPEQELSGTYAYGELLMMGYTDAQIRRLRDKVKIIGDRSGKRRRKYG